MLKQAPGSNFDSWGTQLNLGALDLVDDAFGVEAIAVGANVTLSVQDYLADEARALVLVLTGAGGFTVTVPAVDKPYFVDNQCAADVTVTPTGGAGAVVRAGTQAWWYSDGTDGFVSDVTLDKVKTAAADVALGGFKLTGVGTATTATDAATLSNRPEQFATPTGPLAMGGQKITGVGAATSATDAASLANRLDQFAAPTANVSLNSQRLTNVADPVDPQDAATKNWFDTTYSTLAGITSEVVTVSGIAADVTTVAANDADVSTVAGIAANVTTVAGVAANVTTVAGIDADVTSVAGNATDISKVAVIDADVSAVAAIDANVTTVAGIDANVTAVAGISADVTTVAGLSSADLAAVAAIDADVTTVAGISADVTTAAANVVDITNFADVYLGAAASDPATRNDASALVAGDLYFNTVADEMRVYTGLAWKAAGSAVNGTIERQTYTATAAQTTFAVTYDVGFVDVWLNGVKLLVGTDFTATSGVDIVLASGATGGDIIDIIAFGAFSVANTIPQSRQVIAGNGLSGGGNLSTDVTLSVIEVPTPTNVSPANAATDITETPTLEGSVYLSLYGKTQKSSQWQISTVADFASTVYDSGEVLGVGVTHVVPAGNLSTSQLYYWRVRYRDTDDVFSAYSTGTTFTTAASFNDFVATPAAIPSIGASHEGGFYFGQIWDERTTSATSTAIGTGSKTFTVTDAAPLFYSGQAVKVVSRGDAGGRVMEGTVTASIGTTLTVNVTSVTGSGTYTDWSVLVKYRLIVAPKSSGDNASVAFKNANTAAPVATQTLTNGPAATAAMVAADTSTVYPLAHWADGLSIGGFSDWYAPARDELELIWRNLKPVTNNNDTSDRPKSAIAYTNGGNIDDLSADTHGVNRHSDPAGAAYTSTVPAQTSVAAFQSGGAEALETGSVRYWSSSELSSVKAWAQNYLTSFPGSHDSSDKTNANRARAVRRSIV
jgi:hypothetical protein